MGAFATVADMRILWRPMSKSEEERAEALLPIISDELRMSAKKVGKNLDKMIIDSPELSSVAKSVAIDVCARALMTSTNSEPVTQMSQSALGYSFSGTYLVPGGGLFIKRAELARLGLLRQRIGVIDLWEPLKEEP